MVTKRILRGGNYLAHFGSYASITAPQLVRMRSTTRQAGKTTPLLVSALYSNTTGSFDMARVVFKRLPATRPTETPTPTPTSTPTPSPTTTPTPTPTATPIPAAPTNLTATAASSSQINLSWTDNSNNETGFKVERSKAYNAGGNSGYSNVASATTLP
jgi:hypothetical protein